ncbi:YgfZ/GcvT domain-containing protein [Bowdeniella nasicola]|uniref:CAF17-like 4Fe-4S cluster assembly/insertion protein YgfZ n=1 Tax=Bowdeniella nasicola TaxID=208480 RepID=UPI000AA9FA36|nr:glycine cleavage T C-terminal barrel domain-containing protein [Bowdeniella nasicola]
MIDFSTLPDAVLDDDVLLHRGRPVHEFRDFTAGRAIVPLPQISAIEISGADRLTWLHALSSQHLAQLPAGEATEALILTPNGHVTAAMRLIDDGERIIAFVDRACEETLSEHLKKMVFASRVEITTRPGSVIAFAGEAIAEPPLATEAVWRDPWPHVDGGTTFTTPGVEPDVTPTALALVGDEDLAAFATAHPEAIAGSLAYEAARISSWRPQFATEVDERVIPMELDWLRTAVHLNKGCYAGQETIARVVNLGRPPRRLVLLHLDGSAEHLPEPGAAVTFGPKNVGKVTSAVRHPELGPIALALVKRTTPPDADLLVDDVPAAQEIIVDPSGESPARPASRPGDDLRGARNRGLQKPPTLGGLGKL